MANGRQRVNARIIDFPLSFLISLIWVSSYGYKYNVHYLNSPFVNWYSLMLWTIGLFCTIRIYRFIVGRVSYQSMTILFTWFLYFLGLWALEFVGYYVVKIRLDTVESPLLFGVIHGPLVLKTYYVLAGPCMILLMAGIDKVYEVYQKQKSQSRNLTGEKG
jgi:hypothetical protein